MPAEHGGDVSWRNRVSTSNAALFSTWLTCASWCSCSSFCVPPIARSRSNPLSRGLLALGVLELQATLLLGETTALMIQLGERFEQVLAVAKTCAGGESGWSLKRIFLHCLPQGDGQLRVGRGSCDGIGHRRYDGEPSIQATMFVRMDSFS